MARAAVLCVGDEVVRGEVVNTNASDVARALVAAGHEVVRHAAVGDEPVAIARELALARGEAELLVVSGGLGPTHDDVTLDAVAGALGLPLAVDARAEAWVVGACRRLGRSADGVALRMARVPRGAEPLENRAGVAPAIRIRAGGLAIVLLPGVPAELRWFLGELFPPAGEPAEAVVEAVLATPDESAAAKAVAAAERASGARIGIYPGEGEVRVRARGGPRAVEAAMRMLREGGLVARAVVRGPGARAALPPGTGGGARSSPPAAGTKGKKERGRQRRFV